MSATRAAIQSRTAASRAQRAGSAATRAASAARSRSGAAVGTNSSDERLGSMAVSGKGGRASPYRARGAHTAPRPPDAMDGALVVDVVFSTLCDALCQLVRVGEAYEGRRALALSCNALALVCKATWTVYEQNPVIAHLLYYHRVLFAQSCARGKENVSIEWLRVYHEGERFFLEHLPSRVDLLDRGRESWCYESDLSYDTSWLAPVANAWRESSDARSDASWPNVRLLLWKQAESIDNLHEAEWQEMMQQCHADEQRAQILQNLPWKVLLFLGRARSIVSHFLLRSHTDAVASCGNEQCKRLFYAERAKPMDFRSSGVSDILPTRWEVCRVHAVYSDEFRISPSTSLPSPSFCSSACCRQWTRQRDAMRRPIESIISEFENELGNASSSHRALSKTLDMNSQIKLAVRAQREELSHGGAMKRRHAERELKALVDTTNMHFAAVYARFELSKIGGGTRLLGKANVDLIKSMVKALEMPVTDVLTHFFTDSSSFT
jgi:hypothetical protein